jgi:adenylylsulfate reductase subunit B
MPTFVNPDKCDGCKALDRPACMYICPNDLMKLDQSIGRAYNQEPDACWECFACIKMCPQTAIDLRGYADVMPMGATATPLRGTDSIMWAIKFRDGTLKRFRFPIRTTPWGSIQPYAKTPEPVLDDLKMPDLVGNSLYLGVDKIPAPAR